MDANIFGVVVDPGGYSECGDIGIFSVAMPCHQSLDTSQSRQHTIWLSYQIIDAHQSKIKTAPISVTRSLLLHGIKWNPGIRWLKAADNIDTWKAFINVTASLSKVLRRMDGWEI